MSNDFAKLRHRFEQKLKSGLTKYFPANNPLNEAMHYSCLNGGKRLRPLLVYLTGQMLGASLDSLDAPAIAVELIHCYSLVHDDLPAMDNANLRRGKPTCHKIYGDDMAILVGDALLTEAFHLLAHAPLSHRQQLKMIIALSKAAGAHGMVLGQAIDIRSTTAIQSQADLAKLHTLKTGALIKASVLLGAYASHTITQEDLEQLSQFADKLGLLFQITDDIIDVESDTATLGKPQGIDAHNQKKTYADLLGIKEAKSLAAQTAEQARSCLTTYKEKAALLIELSDTMEKRSH